MRLTRFVGVALGLAVLTGSIALLSCATTATPPANEMTAEEKVARGSYLVAIAGCGDCHTPGTLFGAPDMTRELSGSELGWRGPWGVTYATNLTPHAETGIGTWTEPQIVTALRAGHRPDGSPLLPPMPWANYSRMSDADAFAIAAYLKSIPAIEHKVPDTVPPGQPATGSIIEFPAPSAWDTPPVPVPAASEGGH